MCRNLSCHRVFLCCKTYVTSSSLFSDELNSCCRSVAQGKILAAVEMLPHDVLGLSRKPLQLDWASNTRRQKNNLPKNQKGYDNWDHRWKALGEENSDLPGLFSVIIFDLLIFKTSNIMVPTKIDPADLDSPRRIFVCRGLRPFWGTSEQWLLLLTWPPDRHSF